MTPSGFGQGNNGAWRALARCREAPKALFFPEHDEDAEPARTICRGCPVQAACANYALADPDLVGVWGGLDEAERRLIRVGAAPGEIVTGLPGAIPASARRPDSSLLDRRTGLRLIADRDPR